MKKPTFNTELDPIGQYYASVITPDHPGQFMLSAYLKEVVDPAVLQQAVNGLMRRLPFLCGRLEPKFFWCHHKLLPTPPQIVWMGDTSKQAALLLSCADEDADTAAGTLAIYERILKYYEWKDTGTIIATGVEHVGDIGGHDALLRAQKLGQEI